MKLRLQKVHFSYEGCWSPMWSVYITIANKKSMDSFSKLKIFPENFPKENIFKLPCKKASKVSKIPENNVDFVYTVDWNQSIELTDFKDLNKSLVLIVVYKSYSWVRYLIASIPLNTIGKGEIQAHNMQTLEDKFSGVLIVSIDVLDSFQESVLRKFLKSAIFSDVEFSQN